jgi:beta-mannanase
LVIFWEATDYNVGGVNQPRFSYDAMLRGDWDEYFKSFAAGAKAYGGEVILVPFSEMNGNWFPISGTLNGNTPAKHNAAYQRIRGFFRDATNVKFGWAPNNISVPNTPGNQIKDYYPGDAYVDIVGVDGFNFGTNWMTFSQVFNDSLAILKTYRKPIYIFSFASAAGTGKAEWIRDAIDVQIPKLPEIKGWVWFNESKERNWLVNSDPASLAAFKAAIQ